MFFSLLLNFNNFFFFQFMSYNVSMQQNKTRPKYDGYFHRAGRKREFNGDLNCNCEEESSWVSPISNLSMTVSAQWE